MLAEKLYNLLTNKKHRFGKKDLSRKIDIVQNIRQYIEKGESIHFFQFWGGAKNPNLPVIKADLCERKSLDHLFNIHREVIEYYKPGLTIIISTGDGRVEYANRISKKSILAYNDSFSEMLSDSKYGGIFQLVPVSKLYEKKDLFWTMLDETYREINENIGLLTYFKKFLTNAGNNVNFQKTTPNQNDATEAALRYISLMITEEKIKLYEGFEDHIRTFFIKFNSNYSEMYKRFLPELKNPFLTSKCSLSFYTGSKGNITQPWQAMGVEENGQILFLSQKRLKEYKSR